MDKIFDLNLIRTLISVYEEKNLKQAGHKLGLTESAVSKQLAKLTNQLGHTLFERTSTGLIPTQYTLDLLPEWQESLQRIETAANGLSFSAKKYNQPITIAITSAIIFVHGVSIYHALKTSLPNAKITILGWQSDTIKKISNQEITFGVHYWNEDRSSDIHQKVLLDDEIIFAMAAKHALPWEKAKHQPFIKVRTYGWSDYRFRYLEHLAQQDIKLNIEYEIDKVSFLWDLLQNEPCICAAPRLVLPKNVVEVITPEHVRLDLKISTSTRLADRTNPLHIHLAKIIKDIINPKNQ